MELGDKVLYYSYSISDQDCSVNDTLAFVLGIIDEHTIDIVLIPPGGPLEFKRVSQYVEDDPYAVPGQGYWRSIGEAPPDQKERLVLASNNEWNALIHRQRQQCLAAVPGDRDSIKEKHLKEQNALAERLRKQYPHLNPEVRA